LTVIASESFIRIYDELTPLFRSHWLELGPFRDRMPLAPNLQTYHFLEMQNELLTLTARQENSRLVGYLIAAVRPGLHYSKTLQAITDIPYVMPEVRGRGIGVRLFLTAQEEFKRRKVGPWFASYKIGSPLAPSMDKLLRWIGMTPQDVQFSKWID
jgi:GNAT superfamily N-acetyltransferase